MSMYESCFNRIGALDVGGSNPIKGIKYTTCFLIHFIDFITDSL